MLSDPLPSARYSTQHSQYAHATGVQSIRSTIIRMYDAELPARQWPTAPM
jgi:hypothetical protein